MSDIGICGLCNENIRSGEGYVFYSATVPPGGNSETGLMHLCDVCTREWINDRQFQADLKTSSSMKAEELSSDISKAFEWLKRGNAFGIIALCKAHGMSAEQARAKARHFADLIWKDKQQAVNEATKFWTSMARKSKVNNTVKQERQETAGGCFVATACYDGNAYHHDINLLKAFRDNFLIKSTLGNHLVSVYYRFSPSIARNVSKSRLRQNKI